MKKNTNKVVLVLLCICLIVLAIGILSSCNKRRGLNPAADDTKTREEACNTLLTDLLVFTNDNWNIDGEDTSIISLEDAGSYIENYNWYLFFVDTLKASTLRTSTIQNFSSFIKSEMDSKKGAISQDDGEENLETGLVKILGTIKRSGIISDEALIILYDVVYNAVNQAQTIYANIYAKCSDVASLPGVSDRTRSSLVKTREETKRIKAYIDRYLTNEVKDGILKGMVDNKEAFQVIYKSIYDLALIGSRDNIIELINGSGAFHDLTINDISNYLNSVKGGIQSVLDFYDNNTESMSDVAKTLNSMANIVDSLVVKNDIADGVFTILQFATIVIDVVPVLGDFLIKAWDAFDTKFIEDFINIFIRPEKPIEENSLIFVARLVLKFREKSGTTDTDRMVYIKSIFNDIKENAKDGLYSSMIYLVADYLLAMNNDGKYFNPETKVEDIEKIANSVSVFWELSKVKSRYRDYLNGLDNDQAKLSTAASSLLKVLADASYSQEGVVVPTAEIGSQDPDVWFRAIYKYGKDAAIYFNNIAIPLASADLEHYIDELFVENAIEDIANAAFITTTADDDANRVALENKAKKAYLILLVALIPSIITQ